MQFFEAVTTGTIYVDSHLSVVRRRAVTIGFEETIEIENHGKDPVDLEVKLEAASDFADLFEVKDKLAKVGEIYNKVTDGALTSATSAAPSCARRSSRPTRRARSAATGSCSTSRSRRSRPGRSASTCAPAGAGPASRTSRRRAGRADSRTRSWPDGLEKWVASAPRLVASWAPLNRIYRRSLVDLAALRFETGISPGALPAAGLPWFMAMFGRDSLLTSFQALPFAPELAATTLRALALLQARDRRSVPRQEPGKILHELRLGEMTAFEERPHSPYYGAADATPLFLILLEEYERWTGDTRAGPRPGARGARGARTGSTSYGDRDGDGYVEYERRNAETGLDNQCWKDSWDSIAFADGTLAPLPRATCEMQGYVYDAKRRTARLAREVWSDPALGRASSNSRRRS